MTISLSDNLKRRIPQMRNLAAGIALAVGIGLLAPAALAESHGGGVEAYHGGGFHGGYGFGGGNRGWYGGGHSGFHGGFGRIGFGVYPGYAFAPYGYGYAPYVYGGYVPYYGPRFFHVRGPFVGYVHQR